MKKPPSSPSSYFSGRVQRVVYENESSAFYVLKMTLDAEPTSDPDGVGSLLASTATVTGDVPGMRVAPGSWFGFEARWQDDPKYGRQLKITRAPMIRGGWDETVCVRMLAAQGVSEGLIEQFKTTFGSDLANAVGDAARVASVPGVSQFTAEHIATKWRAARAHFQAVEFLGDLGLPAARVRQVWAVFGDEATAVLAQNPWALTQIDGISFRDADLVAARLKLDTTAANPKRVEGAVLFASRSQRGFGHLYVSAQDLLAAARVLDPLFTDRDIASAIRALSAEGLIHLDRVTAPGVSALYEPWSYRLEVESARLVSERRVGARLTPAAEARCVKNLIGEDNPTLGLRAAGAEYLKKICGSSGLTLSDLQSEAVLNALTEPVTLITGLPGTGKTTCLRMACALLREAGVAVLIVAPTGIAAKRVSSVTGAPASTIHRAFGARGVSSEKREATYAGVVGEGEASPKADGSDEVWAFGPDSPHPAEVIIVDESSMVDQHVFYRVLSCTRADARLVFVGDAAQLPSVGPGNVLRDLIDSRLYPTVSLTEIFRQADTSPIIKAAHEVHAGVVPEAPPGSDFCLFPFSDDGSVADAVVQLATRLYQNRVNFQVLSPRHGGAVGVTTLNTRLREVLNPRQPSLQEVPLGDEVLREGDRIMVVKNDYKLGVFNGDVGKVAGIDRKAREIEIKVHGPPVLHVRVPFKTAAQLLRLAYAVTVHRCQGLEYDVIVMPVVNSFNHQLQRNLFYTAITRAKRRVYLLGSWEAVGRAVRNDRSDARNTLFRHRLT